MKMSSESNTMVQVLTGLLRERNKPSLTLSCGSGQNFPIFEPITIGPDFLMGRSTVDPQSALVVIPWSAVENIRLP